MQLSPPPPQLLIRHKAGINLVQVNASVMDNHTPPSTLPFHRSGDGQGVFSVDGAYLAITQSQVVEIYEASAEEGARDSPVAIIPRPNVAAVSFSPLGTYVITWERPSEKKDDDRKNLHVWHRTRVEDSSQSISQSISQSAPLQCMLLRSFHCRSSPKDLWPPISWSSCEQQCCQAGGDQLYIYNGDLSILQSTLSVPKIVSVSVCPSPSSLSVTESTFTFFSVFAKADRSRNLPAIVSVYKLPLTLPTQSSSFSSTPHLLSTKSIFRCDKVEFLWSGSRKAVIAHATTEVDTTGGSYYGESGLYLLPTVPDIHGEGGGEICRSITIHTTGTIYDVAWSPSGKDFITITGTMPGAKATMYDSAGTAVFDMGCAPRNSIRWSPHGRFFVLGGWGSLAGEMDIWDRHKLKKIGSTQSLYAIIQEWSPCSRFFATAVTAPRRRVDNEYKVFKYNGVLLCCVKYDELYSLSWRPAPPSLYPDLPISPRAKKEMRMEIVGEDRAAAVTSGVVGSASHDGKRQAYRPPGAREGGTTGSIQAMLAGLRGTTTTTVAVKVGTTVSTEPSKAALKNKKKREAKAKRREDDGVSSHGDDEGGRASGGGDASPDAGGNSSTVAASQQRDGDCVVDGEKANEETDIAKQIRALEKKIRQIEQLKDQKTRHGRALTTAQEAKIGQEGVLVTQLERLRVMGNG